jgi:hypothetical protein
MTPPLKASSSTGVLFQRRSHKEKRTPVEEEAFKGGVTKRRELQSKRKLSKEESLKDAQENLLCNCIHHY